MPQTVEAINHAKGRQGPGVVAIASDKADAKAERVRAGCCSSRSTLGGDVLDVGLGHQEDNLDKLPIPSRCRPKSLDLKANPDAPPRAP
jgi:hypothetical protein